MCHLNSVAKRAIIKTYRMPKRLIATEFQTKGKNNDEMTKARKLSIKTIPMTIKMIKNVYLDKR